MNYKYIGCILIFDLLVVLSQIIDPELFMDFHCLMSFFELISISLQEQQDSLIGPELSIYLDFLGFDVLMKFLDNFLFKVIMLNLTIIKETCAIFSKLSLLFFL